MGMGFAACYADVIEWSAIERLVPKEAAEFSTAIKKVNGAGDNGDVPVGLAKWHEFGSDEDLSELTSTLSYGSEESDKEAAVLLSTLLMKLKKAFRKATLVKRAGRKRAGLELGLGYHDQENNGDRYDEIAGTFWYVDGAYDLTPAGAKFKKLFERKTFVELG